MASQKPSKQTLSHSGTKKKSSQKQQSGGGMLVKTSSKEFRKQTIRTGRRVTTDPFTTEVVAKEVIGIRQGLMHGKLKVGAPTPEFAPRVFPGSKTLVKQPIKRVKF